MKINTKNIIEINFVKNLLIDEYFLNNDLKKYYQILALLLNKFKFEKISLNDLITSDNYKEIKKILPPKKIKFIEEKSEEIGDFLTEKNIIPTDENNFTEQEKFEKISTAINILQIKILEK